MVFDSKDIYEDCLIADDKDYGKYLNQYPVIHSSFKDLPKKCVLYEQYIERIEHRLIKDLRVAYPEVEVDKEAYLIFLMNLLKDRPYVKLAYMTGILPIAKYSSGSELNMLKLQERDLKLLQD